MSTTTLLDRSTTPPMLMRYAMVHDAMVRDAERLQRALAGPVALARARGLVAWFDRFTAEIVHHHEREDDLVFPAVAARAPHLAGPAAELAAEHAVLDAAMRDLTTALQQLTVRVAGCEREQAAAAAARFASVLVDHLRREEAVVLDAIAAVYTLQEYEDLERRLLKETPRRLLAFEAPWVLDGLPDAQRREVLSIAPLPLRVLYRTMFEPAYVKLTAALVA